MFCCDGIWSLNCTWIFCCCWWMLLFPFIDVEGFSIGVGTGDVVIPFPFIIGVVFWTGADAGVLPLIFAKGCCCTELEAIWWFCKLLFLTLLTRGDEMFLGGSLLGTVLGDSAMGAGLEVLEWGLKYMDVGVPASFRGGGHWKLLPDPTSNQFIYASTWSYTLNTGDGI